MVGTLEGIVARMFDAVTKTNGHGKENHDECSSDSGSLQHIPNQIQMPSNQLSQNTHQGRYPVAHMPKYR